MSNPEQLSPESFEYYLDIGLEQQYRQAAQALDRLGLLEVLPESGEKGIMGIDGKEYPIPSLDSIKTRIKEKREVYQTKFNQGFTELQLTPFGLPLEMLAAKLEEQIVKHHREGKLLATKSSPTDPNKTLELDTRQPLYVWDKWIDKTKPLGEHGSDVSGDCVYHPHSFSQTEHGGQTKQQLLDIQRQTKDPFAGWEVKILEASPNIPREGKGRMVGKRKQLEINKTPEQYLDLLHTDPQYQNEQGETNEDWVTQFLVHLEKHNQVIDDYQGKAFLAGSYLPASVRLGCGYWYRGSGQACLSGYGWRSQDSDTGCRSAVGV